MEQRPPRDGGGVGDAEQTMALFDACWFHRLVLLPLSPEAAAAPPALASSPTSPESRGDEELQRAPSSGLRHRRSRSDEASVDGLEPLRVPNGHRARLETILSGKDGLAPPPPTQSLPLPERRRPEVRRPGRRHRRRRGRSLSELEFEEVKGLQDLGFTFSEEEVDAELASIVPGLRRRRAEAEEEAKRALAAAEEEEARRRRTAEAAAAPRRPYLSEAWDDEEEEVKRMLQNWRIPAAGDGAVLKEHLRLWAHTVASAVQ